RPVRHIFWKRLRRTAFFTGAGSDLNASLDASLGVVPAVTLYRNEKIRHPAWKALDRDLRFGPSALSRLRARFTIYGSNCLDCRRPLRSRAGRMGNLSGKTNAAETRSSRCCARTELLHGNSGNSRAFADSRRGSYTKQWRVGSELR